MTEHITIDPRVARLAALQQANPPGDPRLWALHLEPRAKERVQRVTVTNGYRLLSISAEGLVVGKANKLNTRDITPPSPDIALKRSSTHKYTEFKVDPRLLGELLLAIDDLLQMNEKKCDTCVKMSVCVDDLTQPILIDSMFDEGVHAAIMSNR